MKKHIIKTICFMSIFLTSTSIFFPSQKMSVDDDLNIYEANSYQNITQITKDENLYKEDSYIESIKLPNGILKKKHISVFENATPITFIATFYSSLEEENGTQGVDSRGNLLTEGTVANNFLPYNSKIYLKNYGCYTVKDNGNPIYFNTINRIDIYVPRFKGEDDITYSNRIKKMGVKEIQGYIL